MGCKHSRVISANTVETSGQSKKVLTKEEKRVTDIVKETSKDGTDQEQKKLTELKVLQQLKENNTLSKSYIRTGGVPYNFALNNDIDSMLIRLNCPERKYKRMNKTSDDQYSKEEREMMSDIIRADNQESKGHFIKVHHDFFHGTKESSRRIAEKQEQVRLRREERHKQICEKFERKRKESEERIKKLEAQKKERKEKLTQSILRLPKL